MGKNRGYYEKSLCFNGKTHYFNWAIFKFANCWCHYQRVTVHLGYLGIIKSIISPYLSQIQCIQILHPFHRASWYAEMTVTTWFPNQERTGVFQNLVPADLSNLLLVFLLLYYTYSICAKPSIPAIPKLVAGCNPRT